MDNASSVALSRLIAQQNAIDLVAGNIANANTPGFKAERMVFGEWISRQRGTDAPPGGGALDYTQDRASWREMQEGAITPTGNPLDIAISGTGFFTVSTPAGPRLTRAGRFNLMTDGTIADSQGNALLDTSGQPMQIGPTDSAITIAGDGTLSTQNGPIGSIGVVQVDDPTRLAPEGGRLFRADTPPTPVSTPKLVQGAIEDSNVQPVVEMTRMMTLLREFQFASQFVQAEADRHNTAIDKLLTKRN